MADLIKRNKHLAAASPIDPAMLEVTDEASTALAGEKDGPFWENPALFGKAPDPGSKEWLNFGGDKSWPAPQIDWPNTTPRAWPPM